MVTNMIRIKKGIRIGYIFLYSLIVVSSCNSDGPADLQELGGGYIARYNNRCYIMADNMLKESIYPEVISCVYNKDFILAIQRPNIGDHIMYVSKKLMTIRELETRDTLQTSPIQYNFYRKIINEDSNLFKTLLAKLSVDHHGEDITISHYIADSLIKNNPYYKNIFSRKLNYWIISHKERNENDYLPTSKIYGPFSKNQYLVKRIELGVPEELQLKEK